MEIIKKYLPYILVGVTMLLIFAVVQIFEMNNTIKALERSESLINEQLEELKENNIKEIDSLTDIIDRRNLVIQELEAENIALQEEETDINTQSNENKDRIRDINNAPELEHELSRRYN